MGQPPPKISTWSALRHPPFRLMWIISFIAFIGASVQGTAAAWLSVGVHGTAFEIALVQGSMYFGMLLMSLPAGMLADTFERRDIIIIALVVMSLIGAAMSLLALAGDISPSIIIVLTLLFGLGATAITPALQATLPDLVPRGELSSAVTLNSMAVSAARAFGPGIAGIAISRIGTAYVIAANAAAFAIIGALLFMAGNRISSVASLEKTKTPLREGLLQGLNFARRDPDFRQLLQRTFILAFCASPLLALIPVIVARQLAADADALGLLLTAFGAGALLGSLILNSVTQIFTRNSVVLGASLLHGIALLVVALITNILGLMLTMLLAGAAWTALTISINVSAQLLLPTALRARGLSISLMFLMGSMAFGGALWGKSAEQFGLQNTMLTASGIAIAVSSYLLLRDKLKQTVIMSTHDQ